MRKILLSILAIATFATATAQKKGGKKAVEKEEVETETTSKKSNLQSSKGENYLPEQGDWAIGFNANSIFKNLARSFNGSEASVAPEQINMKEAAFVGKLFIQDNQAYRVIVNLGFGSNTNTATTTTGIALPRIETDIVTKAKEFDIQVGLGKEWRRGKTRLQGFYGADALVGFNTGKDVDEVTTTKTTSAANVINSTFVGVNNNAGSTITVGINGFIGAEYFILPKLALGAQYNWGLGIAFTGAGKSTLSATGSPDVETENTGKSTSFFFGTRDSLSNAAVGVGTASLNLTLHF
jgi:hypothetical protein